MTFPNLMKVAKSFLNRWKTLWEKEKLLITSNFSLSHSVLERLVLYTCKNQGLFGVKSHSFLSSAYSFNLAKYKILSFGKELNLNC